jgi:hypothetical protein
MFCSACIDAQPSILDERSRWKGGAASWAPAQFHFEARDASHTSQNIRLGRKLWTRARESCQVPVYLPCGVFQISLFTLIVLELKTSLYCNYHVVWLSSFFFHLADLYNPLLLVWFVVIRIWQMDTFQMISGSRTPLGDVTNTIKGSQTRPPDMHQCLWTKELRKIKNVVNPDKERVVIHPNSTM